MNALEDIVETYLRQVITCPFVDRNIFTGENNGEVDAIGIIMKPQKVIIVEAAAGKNLYGKDTVKKIREKFRRAIKHVKAQDHLENFGITLEFWAPHISDIKKKQLEEQKVSTKRLKVIDHDLIVERLSEIQKVTKGLDVKTLDGVSQLLRLLPEIKT